MSNSNSNEINKDNIKKFFQEQVYPSYINATVKKMSHLFQIMQRIYRYLKIKLAILREKIP